MTQSCQTPMKYSYAPMSKTLKYQSKYIFVLLILSLTTFPLACVATPWVFTITNDQCIKAYLPEEILVM